MEEDFLNWQHFSLVPRRATFGEHGVIELMVVNNQKDYAFKYVNGHPNNTQQQLLSVTGFGVLSQMENGYQHLFQPIGDWDVSNVTNMYLYVCKVKIQSTHWELGCE